MQTTTLNAKLQLALDACRAATPLLTGEVCFRSIGVDFKKRGVTYRDLAALARLGYLQKSGTGRYVVYYRIVEQPPTPQRRRR
jgi:hypothetical protein